MSNTLFPTHFSFSPTARYFEDLHNWRGVQGLSAESLISDLLKVVIVLVSSVSE